MSQDGKRHSPTDDINNNDEQDQTAPQQQQQQQKQQQLQQQQQRGRSKNLVKWIQEEFEDKNLEKVKRTLLVTLDDISKGYSNLKLILSILVVYF